MKFFQKKVCFWASLFLLLLTAACGQSETTPTAAPTEVSQAATNTPTAEPPSPEPTDGPPTNTAEPTELAEPTATPTVEPSPTEAPAPTLEPEIEATPWPAPTPWPLAENALSPANVGQIVEIGRLGWGEVERLRYSPDGRLLAVATNLGIYLHDAQTGEQLQVIEVSSPLVSFNFSADGALMASGHNDRRIRIWQVSDGSLVRTIENETAGAVWSVAFSPDGQFIASSITNENGLIYLWRVEDGSLVRTFSGHQSRVRDVVFSSDGRFLASASIDWEARLWNVDDGSEHARLRGHDGPVWRVVFTPDSQTLISAGSGGETGVWGVEDGARENIFVSHASEVIGLAVSPDGERFYTAAEDGYLRVWETATQEQVFELDFDYIVQEVTVSPDGQTIAVLLANNIVKLFDAQTGEAVEPALPYAIGGNNLIYSPDGSELLITSLNDVALWSTTSSLPAVRSLTGEMASGVLAIVYDPNGRYFAHSSTEAGLRMYNAASLEAVGSFPDDPPFQLVSMDTSGNGERIAGGWTYYLITVFHVTDALAAQSIFNIETAGWITTVALNSDGTLLFGGSREGMIERWELPASDEIPGVMSLNPLLGHSDQVTELALSPDGSLLASGDRAGHLILWQVEDGSVVAELEGGVNGIYSITFSPDGRLLLAGSSDGSIRIWQTDNQRLLKSLTGLQTFVNALVFSPDGTTLAAGTNQGVVYFWGLPTE